MRSPFDYRSPGDLWSSAAFGGKGGGGGGGTQTVQSQTQTQLPQWVQNAAQDIYGYGQQVSQELQPAYPGQRVADLTSGEQSIIQGIGNVSDMTMPAFNAAQASARGETNFQPGQVTPGSLAQTDLQPYMNPFTQQVIDKSMPLIDQQRQMALNQGADQAVSSNAFGGSRQGVMEGVTNAQAALGAGQLGAQLNQANFSQAQGAAQSDLARSLAAQQSNQAAGLQGAGLRLGAASTLGQLAGQSQQSLLGGMSAALAAQGQYRQNQQDVLNANQQAYGENRQQAIDRLKVQLTALGGVPYGQTQTQTQTGPGPESNGMMQGLGAAGTGIGILGSLGSLFAPAGGSAAMGLASMFKSDRSEKTDIRKIGKDEETGLPLYAYRYKGDPKTYKKVVGPMAQDLQAKYPGTVREVGGKLAVDAGALAHEIGPVAVRNLGFGSA